MQTKSSVFIAGLCLSALMSSAALATPYSDLVQADNPIAYYQFSETSGTTAFDSAGPNNGTYMGGANPAVSGLQNSGMGAGNSAAGFNGSSAFISTPLSMSGLGAFAIEAWVMPAAAQGNRTGLVGQNDAQEFGFINATTIELWHPSVGAIQVPYDTGANAGQWVHIVAQGNGSQKQIYLNGVLAGTQNHAPTANYGSSGFPVNIGGGGIQDGGGNFFNGVIDEVAIYNAPLSPDRILQHYTIGAAVPTPVGTLVVPPGGGKVSGSVQVIDPVTGQNVPMPTIWTLQKFTTQPGLRTEWYNNAGADTIAEVNAFLAGNPTPTVPVFFSDQVAFGGPVGFPTEVVNAGQQGGSNRVVRYTGQIFIPEDGTYRFKDGVDQSTQLTIGGQTVISDNLWTGFNGTGGDNGGSAINSATFDVADGGQWLDFEFIMGEDCCGTQASLFWDYDPNLGLGANPDFPASSTQAAGLNALVAPDFFRSLTLAETLTGGGTFEGVFMDGMGNMIVFNPDTEALRLTIDANGLVFVTTDVTIAQVIPEPATGMLLLIGVAGMTLRRRNRAA